MMDPLDLDVLDAMRAAWRPIETAPKGAMRQVKAGERTREVFERAWIWIFRESDGHMTKACWVPGEKRWNAYTVNPGPTHWQPIFTPPAPEDGP